MQLEGQVIDIIYKNDINSYTVATFETSEQEETTIVGYLPFVNEGDNLKITGDIVKHPDYGEQFKIATFEKTMPTTPEALEKYLSNGSFKGVGPATAKKIVNTFGKDTINVIKLEPQKLTQIKGISKEKALEITEQFVANWEIWQIVGFLDKFGIGPQSAEGVYKKLGEGALERISENPYILVDVASKVNFEKVDRIAMEMGVEESNYKRIRSGIKYGLEKIGLNGNSCVLYDNLIKYEQDLLRVDINNIEEAIIQMKAKEEIVLEDRPDGKEWVYSKNFYEAEKNIAEKIVGLRNADNVKRIRTLREDLRIIEAVNLKSQEASLTGESVPVEKITEKIDGNEIGIGDRKNMLFSSSLITYGRGKAIVAETGMKTEVGKIAGMLSNQEEKETPLQAKLNNLGKTLGIGIVGLLQMILLVGTALISAKTFLEPGILDSIIDVSKITPYLGIITIIYFIFGYFEYALLYALTGSTVSKPEDIQSANGPVAILSVIGFYLSYFTMMNPASELNVFASMFPISSPFCMPFRIMMGLAKPTDVIISIIILLITGIIIAKIAIKIYSNAILNYGTKMSFNDIVKMYKD